MQLFNKDYYIQFTCAKIKGGEIFRIYVAIDGEVIYKYENTPLKCTAISSSRSFDVRFNRLKKGRFIKLVKSHCDIFKFGNDARSLVLFFNNFLVDDSMLELSAFCPRLESINELKEVDENKP